MNFIQRAVQKVDRFQRAHGAVGFPYAVIKKYGGDQAGYQAALVTYYGFLSLFPLLLVLTTVAGLVGRHDPALGKRLVDSVSTNFPVIGKQLNSSVHGISKSGPALVIGILFTLYGARGVADAFRNAVNHIWHIPQADRSGFPRSLVRSLGIIIGGGGGLLATSVIAGWAASAGRGWWVHALSIVINLALLGLVFIVILRLSLPRRLTWRELETGALITAVGLTILQVAGVYIFKHQARSLSSYGALFATTLGLLAWIYLQVQVVIYAIEIDTVRSRHLWPRSLSGRDLTDADKLAFSGQVKKERPIDQESVRTGFKAS